MFNFFLWFNCGVNEIELFLISCSLCICFFICWVMFVILVEGVLMIFNWIFGLLFILVIVFILFNVCEMFFIVERGMELLFVFLILMFFICCLLSFYFLKVMGIDSWFWSIIFLGNDGMDKDSVLFKLFIVRLFFDKFFIFIVKIYLFFVLLNVEILDILGMVFNCWMIFCWIVDFNWFLFNLLFVKLYVSIGKELVVIFVIRGVDVMVGGILVLDKVLFILVFVCFIFVFIGK